MAKKQRRYSKKASDTVASAMRRRKRGTLRSSSGQKVTNPKQAIAIGLSEAREKGARVPPEKSRRKSAGGRSSTRKRSTTRKSAAGRRRSSSTSSGRKK
jgi:Family of unknown function (DUF6496)